MFRLPDGNAQFQFEVNWLETEEVFPLDKFCFYGSQMGYMLR